MSQLFLVTIFLVAAILINTGVAQTLEERNGIINGTLLQSMVNFPHHVGIYIHNQTYSNYCSGNIISHHWILTTASCACFSGKCVENITMSLMFNRLNIGYNAPPESKSYTITITQARNQFHVGVSNFGLIYVPVAIEFNSVVAAVALALDPYRNYTGSYAVMAGIKQNTTQESYGEFEIISEHHPSGLCSKDRICTLGWHNSSTVACARVGGGGLLVDWPWSPRLVGIFSDPTSCLSYIMPSAYFRVSNYMDWITEVIGQHVNNDGYFVQNDLLINIS